MTNAFDVDRVRRDIETLILEMPDLADDEVLRADMLEGATEMHDVLERLLDSVAETTTFIAALGMRIEVLKKRQLRFARRVETVRALMLKVMQTADLKKIVLAEATLSQRNSPQQVVGEIVPNALPDSLCRIVREPDRAAIKNALLRGDAVPGLALSNAPPTLTISVR